MYRRIAIFLFALPIASGQSGPRGLQALRDGKPAEAEPLLRHALAADPNRAELLVGLGLALSAQERYRDAEPLFKRVCDSRPEDPNACYYLGRARFSVGKFADSLAAFQIALKNGKNTGRTWHGMALTHERSGDAANAGQAYQRALKLGRSEAAADYGLFLAQTGKFEEAIAVLRRSGAKSELERVERQIEVLSKRTASTTASVSFELLELSTSLRNGAAGMKHLPETMTGGVAILDIEGNGLPDIYLANGAALPGGKKPDASFHDALFRNLGNRKFENIASKAGLSGAGYNMGAAAADFDGDGFDDLFVTGLRESRLYRNNRDGSFTDVTRRAGLPESSPWSVSAVWLDYDRDGWLDLFVIRYVAWDPASEPSCIDGGVRTYCHPSHYQPLPNALYRNKGDGTFEDVSARSGIDNRPGKGMGVAVSDVDEDGWPDLFVANDTVPNFLLMNQRNGKFREVGFDAGVALKDDGTAVSSMGAVFADFDNDGHDDLTVSTLSDETFLMFRALRPGAFADVRMASGLATLTRPYTGWGVAAADFNNDGFIDLLVACGHVQDNAEKITSRSSRQPLILLLNRGNGTFLQQQFGEKAFYRGLATGDLNGDGLIDAVVTRLNQSPLVVWNRTLVRETHWVAFRLNGRATYGTRVILHTEAGQLQRRLTPTQGYSSSHQPLIHFGLGRAARLKSVTIEWPDGFTQKMSELEVDRVHTVSR